MFKIEKYDPEIEAKTLKLSDRLFHEALKEELESTLQTTRAKTLISSIGTTMTIWNPWMPTQSM